MKKRIIRVKKKIAESVEPIEIKSDDENNGMENHKITQQQQEFEIE